jgi:type VI protein secretion system component VasF
MPDKTEKTDKTDQLQFRQSGLAEQFQHFCKFLDGHINALTTAPKPVDTTVDSPLTDFAITEQVAQLIAEITRIGQIISREQPELADTAVRDFQFLLAAWADEAMIKILGQERLPMAQHVSIERSIFGTVHAGDEFFNKITHMLKRRNMDDICLAAAYWLALMQGFEGRYIGGVGASELHRYTRAIQAISLQNIVLPDAPKLRAVESTPIAVNWFTRIGLFVMPKFLLAFFLGLLLLCLITLELHWRSSTAQLTQTLKYMSDFRQANTDQQEMK